MKEIPPGNAGPQWNDRLFDDLAFIKQHRRYRFSKKTIPSAAVITILLIFFSRAIWMVMVVGRSQSVAVITIACAMIVGILISVITRYYSTLRFSMITTPFFATENIRLINDFLLGQQLNVFRHPKAPEVFQIISRPLGNNGRKREVLIFIADDSRILVNSHFVNQGWMKTTVSRNSAQMARNLAKWIKLRPGDTEVVAG